MLFKAKIEVGLKPGYSDPEGETAARSLRELNYPVQIVQVSKIYSITFESPSLVDAEGQVDEMCKRLLANPTKDNYEYKVELVK